MIPESLKKAIKLLSELPSIGPRQATRLVFYLINTGKNSISELSYALSDLKSIKICERCFFAHQNAGLLCQICADPKRNPKIIAVVEKPTSIISIEKTKRYNGHYFILGDLAKSGVLEAAQRLRIKSLGERLKKDFPDGEAELVIALSPTTFGDFTAQLITQELRPLVKKISRLGRGLPTGGEIEFADEETLINALERRL